MHYHLLMDHLTFSRFLMVFHGNLPLALEKIAALTTCSSKLVASSTTVAGMTINNCNTALASRMYALLPTARRLTKVPGTSFAILWSNFDFAVFTRSPSFVANELGNGWREYFNTLSICKFQLFANSSILANRVLEFFMATNSPFLLLLVSFLPTTEYVCNFVFVIVE